MRWYASSRSIFAARPAISGSSDALSAARRISSAVSYSQCRAIVRAHSRRRSSTSGAERYSSGVRSNASSSAVVPSSRAASSYSARAWPISFCAIDENATSSSRNGAMPGPLRVAPAEDELVVGEREQEVGALAHCASRSRRHVERPRPLTRLVQPRLDRVAVDAAVLHLELVRELVDLAAPPRAGRARARPTPVGARTARARRSRRTARPARHRARVLERLPLPLLPKDLEDHAASASTTCSTQATSSRESRRKASRSSDAGPWPVTTARSFSQSGSV